MKININEYFENSFNLDSRVSVESLEVGAIKYGGATKINDIIFSNYNNTDEFIINENNTVGIIDSDYFYSDNEGHIFIKITNDSNEGKIVTVEAGQGFAQGLFMPFGITEDDEVSAMRNGGFGSTTT